MTAEDRQAIKNKIIQDMEYLANEIAHLQEVTQPISPECALGDLARFELMNDQVISEKTLKEALIRKRRLDYALSKVDDEDFGQCMECAEDIALERLLILPESTHCIGCASHLDTKS